ncbi:MAG TPA: hypothetical protein VEY95_04525 [Azospirillaceae bacterium]|nr:hypothetical protein [Azospirillaceae bacterium]
MHQTTHFEPGRPRQGRLRTGATRWRAGATRWRTDVALIAEGAGARLVATAVACAGLWAAVLWALD